MANSKEKGKKGEDIALDFLLKRGYILLERNWNFRRCEVDLIMMFEGKIVLVEVKYRKHKGTIELYQVFRPKQMKNLLKAANFYLSNNKLENEVQIDLLFIQDDQNKSYRFTHIPNAIFPEVNQF